MTAPATEVPTGSGRLTRVEQMFHLDTLYDGLTSGRLCGQAFDAETAQILIILLERLEWVPDSRRLAGALPHFPERFAVNGFRTTLATLGFASTEAACPGHLLHTCPNASLIVDHRGQIWLARHDRRGTELVRPGEETENVHRVRRNRMYRVVHFQGSHAVNGTGNAPNNAPSWTADLIRRFAPEIRLMLLLTLLSGFTAICIAFGITMIFDTVIPTRNRETLAGILIGLALVFSTDFAFRRIRSDIVGRVSGRMEFLLGGALLGKLLRLPTSMLTGVSLSDQLARLRQFESVRDLFAGPVTLIILELPLAFLLLAILALIAWPLALLLAISVVAFSSTAFLLAPAIRRETRSLGVAQGSLNRILLEVLEQRRQIGREGLAEIWTDRVEARVRDVARSRRRLASLARWLDMLSQGSLPMVAASVIGLGAILVMQGTLTGGAVIAATILTWRLFAPVQQGLQLLPKLQDVVRLLQQIDAMMRLPEDQDSGGEGRLYLQGAGALTARGVVLRHPKSISPALMGVNLQIPHGSFVTVTGKSGSGKSTLLRVLAGHLAPQAGAVLLNDLNLAQLSRGLRSRNIALVSQRPVFFYGSVAQNLRLCDPDADDTRLMATLAELGLTDWVASLPDGLDTRLDPSVDHRLLPASLLTSISVAQALLGDPVILLLDEPAGNMDAALEAHLVAALERRRGRMTSIVVTHRPSLIRRSDSVIVIESGSARMVDPPERERIPA